MSRHTANWLVLPLRNFETRVHPFVIGYPSYWLTYHDWPNSRLIQSLKAAIRRSRDDSDRCALLRARGVTPAVVFRNVDNVYGAISHAKAD